MSEPSKTVTILTQHDFTDAEIRQIAVKMAGVASEYTRTEAQFASVKADFKSKLERLELDRDDLTDKIRNGFEMRATLAYVFYNDPAPGRKTFVRVMTYDNGETGISAEVIRVEAMEATDFQRDLPLEPVRPLTFNVVCNALDRLVITSENIGEIRAKYLIDGDDEWNALIRDETAQREIKTEPLNPERFPETGDSAKEVREAKAVIEHAAQPIGTPVGAALDQAAVNTKAAQFSLDLTKDDWTVVSLMKAVRIATKAAGWTEAQKSTLNDALKKASGVNAMVDFLRPLVISEDAPAQFGTVFIGDQGDNIQVPLLDCALSAPARFPLEKIIHEFRSAAFGSSWPGDAIDAVVGDAERQARVIGDEPEATEAATRYLRSFCVSK